MWEKRLKEVREPQRRCGGARFSVDVGLDSSDHLLEFNWGSADWICLIF